MSHFSLNSDLGRVYFWSFFLTIAIGQKIRLLQVELSWVFSRQECILAKPACVFVCTLNIVSGTNFNDSDQEFPGKMIRHGTLT